MNISNGAKLKSNISNLRLSLAGFFVGLGYFVKFSLINN